MNPTQVSVLVPVQEHPEPLDAVYREYSGSLEAAGITFEFLFVLEPWWEAQSGALDALRRAGAPIRILQLAQTASEAALLRAAASEARYPVLLILPAYRRVQADALCQLLAGVGAGADAVFAVRSPRRDSWFNRLQTRFFHFLARPITRGRFHDLGAGVAALRAQVLRDTAPYGDSYRFLPVLAERDGYRVEEVELPQHPADTRSHLVPPGVYVRRAVDLLGLFFLVRFTEKPLRFFGLVGVLLGAAGFAILLVLLIQKLGGHGIANRPALLLGTLLIVFGTQSIALGLVAEIIVHLTAPTRRSYRLARPEPPADGGAGDE